MNARTIWPTYLSATFASDSLATVMMRPRAFLGAAATGLAAVPASTRVATAKRYYLSWLDRLATTRHIGGHRSNLHKIPYVIPDRTVLRPDRVLRNTAVTLERDRRHARTISLINPERCRPLSHHAGDRHQEEDTLARRRYQAVVLQQILELELAAPLQMDDCLVGWTENLKYRLRAMPEGWVVRAMAQHLDELPDIGQVSCHRYAMEDLAEIELVSPSQAEGDAAVSAALYQPL